MSDSDRLLGVWRRHGRRWHAAVGVLCFGLVLALLVVSSVVAAMVRSGNESFQAKWADVLRDHHAGFVVTPLEDWYFTRAQPAKGGRPARLNHIPGVALPTAPQPSAAPVSSASTGRRLTPPRDIALIVQPPLADEGRWMPAGPSVGGSPGMYVAQFRADSEFTGQITTAAWIDPTLLRVRLVPGANEPGGTWSVPPAITGDALRHIVAAFNGGFRFKEAQGGFHFDGRDAVALREGAASIAIATDGRVDIGTWGSDVRMASNTEAVLQNLNLLVDNGRIDPSVSHNDTRSWGFTLRGSIAVARSGIGVTADGALVYVAGPALSARSLAQSLQRAGAVRAMTLDLNPEWVTFNLFSHPDPNNPMVVKGAKLFPQMGRPADRYLSTESRDYFTVSMRN